MSPTTHLKAANLLLKSLSSRPGDGLKASFMFGRPGAQHWEKNFGAEVYFRPAEFTQACLFVRQNGPVYLRYHSIEDIWSMLQSFVTENFWYLADQILFTSGAVGVYSDHVSSIVQLQFATALGRSEIFSPENKLTLFPLVTINVREAYDSPSYFLVSPEMLVESRLPAGVSPEYIDGQKFPPLLDWEGKTYRPASWLGVWAPTVQAASKIKAAILGAVALTPNSRNRYAFSGRKMFGGHCSFDGSASFTVDNEGHTPPLMNDIEITQTDHSWLENLSLKVNSNERSVRRELKALEYFYRAWGVKKPERFPLHCMTLDAMFGAEQHATQAVIDGVKETLGSHVRDERLRLLMKLRAAVIHGGAPDVYDSRKYARYYNTYEADPISDIALVVARCLQTKIFNGKLSEHEDPDAKLIEKAKSMGRIPKSFPKRSILDDSDNDIDE